MVWDVLQWFRSSTRTLVDIAARGALMRKAIDEAYDLLEEMTANA